MRLVQESKTSSIAVHTILQIEKRKLLFLLDASLILQCSIPNLQATKKVGISPLTYRLLTHMNESVLKIHRLLLAKFSLFADLIQHGIFKLSLRLSIVCANRR
jgi:hypothetical protein